MLTRRTFIASAATPAALPVIGSESRIERLWREHCRLTQEIDETLHASDQELFADVDRANAVTMELVSTPPNTLREMVLQLHAIDLDPEWSVFVPAFLKHVEALAGEVV